ncbi:MAG: hypothetical protein A4E27_00405 [Methanobacterium sp. PtaU1.Bin242]|nr:MAG: hypothetical protein A4E27_00405 [Methanobacterium sp. PtaU1.Bin242]
MKFKEKLGVPFVFLAILVVMACSVGSVSAANNIHDITIDDTNTDIQHPVANIQDTSILNKVIGTDHITISEAVRGTITSSNLYNQITSSAYTYIDQGTYGGDVSNCMINNAIKNSANEIFFQQGVFDGNAQNCMLNNAVTNVDGYSFIGQGVFGSVQNSLVNNNVKNVDGMSLLEQGYLGTVKESMINNAINDFSGISYIQQGIDNGLVQDCLVNNVVINSSGNSEIHQGTDYCNVQNSCLNNLVYGSEGNTSITQNKISNSQLLNKIMFSENTAIIQGTGTWTTPEQSISCYGSLVNCNITNIVLGSKNSIIFETDLTNVNGICVMIGCTDYTIGYGGLTDKNFFMIRVNNKTIINILK